MFPEPSIELESENVNNRVILKAHPSENYTLSNKKHEVSQKKPES